MEENIKNNDALEEQREEYEKKIEKLKLDFALETALLRAGAKNVKATAALIDKDQINLDEEGRATGLDEQIEKLKGDEQTAFLFSTESPVRGLVPYESGNVPEDMEKMSYARFCEIYGR